MTEPFPVLLCLSLSKSQAYHAILAIEEATVAPDGAYLLQAAVPHVRHIIDKDVCVLVTAVPHLHDILDPR